LAGERPVGAGPSSECLESMMEGSPLFRGIDAGVRGAAAGAAAGKT
jgi:hypothetical protein